MPPINEKVVVGFGSIRKDLSELPAKLANKHVRRGVYAGASVIRDYAKKRVEVDTAALRDALVAQSNKSKKGEISASVGVKRITYKRGEKEGKTPRRYAHLVEFGTVKTHARPFLRPAMDATPDAVIEAVATKIRQGLAEEVKKK